MHDTLTRKPGLTGASILFVLATLAACGGSGGGGGGSPAPATYTVGGTVSGLAAGQGVVLRNNGGDNLTVSANGIFTFATALNDGATYAVTLLTPPGGQSCTVANGSGTLAGANVTNVSVVCTTNTYTVGGNVSGYNGAGLTLRLNGTIDLPVSGNGVFAFVALADGSAYSVTVFSQPAQQVCTVANGSGTLAGVNVTNVAVSCTTNTYTVGGNVGGLAGAGLVLQNNGGDSLGVSANGPFIFGTALDHGAAYVVTARFQPTGQVCTVANGSGTLAGANVIGVSVGCVASPVARFAYVANVNDNTVSLYTLNAATGQLRHNGYVAAGSAPASITVDPSGKFAYVANSGSANVSAYAINAATGALAPIDADTVTAGIQHFAAGTGAASVSVDPSGKFAYVVNSFDGAGGNSVSAYSIDASTGALTGVGTVAAGINPRSVSIDPSGRFAYVANFVSNDISAYRIAATGVLDSVGPSMAAGTNPRAVSVDPSGQFAYVANQGSNNVSAYSIDTATGVLASVGLSVATGPDPRAVTVDPSGKFAYVAYADSVSAYSIDATTGAFGIGAAVTAGTDPVSVTVDPSGQFAYVMNQVSNSVSAYGINASSGALTALSTVSGRAGSVAMAMIGGATAVSYTPKFAYMANQGSNNVSAYTIDTGTGALDGNGTAPAGNGAASVAVDPAGKFVYVANSAAGVSAYTIGATGGLTPVSGVAAGTNPSSITVDPSGRFVYVTNLSDDVSAFIIDSGAGTLASIGAAVPAGTNPSSITVDPSGRFAYVTNQTSNNVSAYHIASTGTLIAVGAPAAAGTTPRSVTVDPSGRFAYVANSSTGAGGNSVSVYRINATTGALDGIGTVAVTSPWSVTVHPSGRFAYATSGNNVSAYTIDTGTGALDIIGGTVAVGGTPRCVSVDPSGKFVYVAHNNGVSAYTIDPASGALMRIDADPVAAGIQPFPAGTAPVSITTTGSIQ